MKRRSFLHTAAALIASVGLSPAFAQSGTPVKIIVPFAAGAGTDAMARFFAAELGKSTGKQFIVENRTGAGGAIGTDFVAKSPPDGNTLLFIASPFTTVSAAGQQPHYNPTEFAPVAIMGAGPLLFAASPSVPAGDLRELIAHARANPGKLNYGSAGNGGINHLILELLKQQAGVEVVHVPYKGIAAATTDLLGGQLQFITGTVPALLPFIKDGRLKALAVTSKGRSAVVPDIPAMEELGFANFDVNNYWGLMAPPGTPESITQALNAEVNKLIAQPAVAERLRQDATEPTTLDLAGVKQFIANDLEKWKTLIRTAGLKFD